MIWHGFKNIDEHFLIVFVKTNKNQNSLQPVFQNKFTGILCKELYKKIVNKKKNCKKK